MERRWVFQLGPHEEVVVATRSGASRLDHAAALAAGEAGRLLERLFPGPQARARRHTLVAMSDLTPTDARWHSEESLKKVVLHRLGRTGQLVMLREEQHGPPCGVGAASALDLLLDDDKPSAPPAVATAVKAARAVAGAAHAPRSAPAHAPHKAAPKDNPGWTGDSSKWSQEKKLLSMHPDLRPKVTAVIAALQKRGFQAKIFFAWRSVAVQLEIFKKGHTKVKFSFHNAQHQDGTPNAYAADIIDGRYAWGPKAESEGFWKALGEEAHTQKLYWGGDWKTFRDWAHVQLVDNPELKRVKKESGL